MTLAARTLRADVRKAFGCPCAGPVDKTPGVVLSRRMVALKGMLGAVEHTMGVRPPSCAWRAFAEEEVGEVMRAYDFFESGQLAFYAGEDPPWRLIEGIQHYHSALTVARADVRKVSKTNRGPAKPPPRKGQKVVGVTRG